MKATLYAVETNAGRLWQASVSFGADMGYWIRRRGERRLFRVEPELSWGQARLLAQRLNAAGCGKRDVKKKRGELMNLSAAFGGGPPAGGAWRIVPAAGVDGSENRYAAAHWPNGERLERLAEALAGRALLFEEFFGLATDEGLAHSRDEALLLMQAALLEGLIEAGSGVRPNERKKRFSRLESAKRWICARCGSDASFLHWTDCVFCAAPCPYCENCLTMGRSRFCTPLITGRPATAAVRFGGGFAQRPDNAEDLLDRYTDRWSLSPAQTAASLAGLHFLRRTGASARKDKRPFAGAAARAPGFLIWAVTGAGKTEMVFPFIDYELARGGRVLIATPRRDVVLELAPRLRKAFPQVPLAVLYGGSADRWKRTNLTLATTHQALRFSQMFSLIVVDELDAFPFHNNPVLEYAVGKALAPGGRYMLLSATPPRRMQRLARFGRLPHAKVPVRFHRRPLPVPAFLRVPPLRRMLSAQRLPAALLDRLRGSLERGAQLFVFVPRIASIPSFTALLQRQFPAVTIAGTSSQDAERDRKVARFREGAIRLLVTTTILERGVTVPKTDVFIVDADAPLFDDAALVQMAGRAGRSPDDPCGRVYFAAQDFTRAQAAAIRQIKRMNALAKRRGYLLPDAPKQEERSRMRRKEG